MTLEQQVEAFANNLEVNRDLFWADESGVYDNETDMRDAFVRLAKLAIAEFRLHRWTVWFQDDSLRVTITDDGRMEWAIVPCSFAIDEVVKNNSEIIR